VKDRKWWNKRILDDLLEDIAGDVDIHVFDKLQRLRKQKIHFPMRESFDDGIENIETSVGSAIVFFHKKPRQRSED
jgi:hypothetical protein